MRALVLELARALPMPRREVKRLAIAELLWADEVFLTNSVRGIVPVGRTIDSSWKAPGVWTQRLMRSVADWLDQGGTEP
jgi:branched-subunit amino acid aminotransferase/4-amino-4-deoxychorismate lyase